MSMVFLVALLLQSPPATPPTADPKQSGATVNAGDLDKEASARGAHFRVTTSFESQAVAEAALAAAESVVAPAATIYGPIEPRPAETAAPIDIVIGSSPGTVSRRFEDLGASDRRSGHIGIDPPLGKRALASAGLPGYMRMVIAREAVHLLAARATQDPGKRLDWFDSGAASWAAEEGLTAAGFLTDRMFEPALSTDALRVRKLAETKLLPALEVIVRGWPGGLTPQERPAVFAHAFRFLKEHPTVFARVLEAAGEFGGTPEGEVKLAQALGNDEEHAQLELEFTASAMALTPEWEEIYPALSTSGTSWLQSGAFDTNAVAWRTESTDADRYALEGELEILPGKSKQMNVLLGRGASGFVQVAFVGDYGIDILRFDPVLEPDKRWSKLAGVEVKGLIPNRSIPFRVTVDGADVSVTIQGVAACKAHVEGVNLRGPWGLGVLADAAGRWRKIAFGRL